MATQTGTSTIDTLLGQPLTPPITFSYSYETFDDVATAKSSGEWPNDADVLKMVNQARQRNALSKARNEETKARAAEIQESPEYKRAEAIKSLVALGMSSEKAAAIIESAA